MQSRYAEGVSNRARCLDFGFASARHDKEHDALGEASPHIALKASPHIAVQDSPVFRAFTTLLSDHPLDQEFRECNAGNNPGDYAERNCTAAFLEKWEKELSETYSLLYQYSSQGPLGKKIKAAQRQWEKFRKAEFAYIEAQYDDLDGTMYEWFEAQEKLTIVRERAILLGNYYLRLKADRD